MRFCGYSLLCLVTLAPIVCAKDPALAEADRVRLAEAFRLADAVSNKVWPEWDKAPFAVLLVTAEHEFLIRHAKPSDDFTLIGEDDLLKSKVWWRKRKFSPGLLATFPAVGGRADNRHRPSGRHGGQDLDALGHHATA